jgi:hypothetical protein
MLPLPSRTHPKKTLAVYTEELTHLSPTMFIDCARPDHQVQR